MSDSPILDPESEEKLKPHELSEMLVNRVHLSFKAAVPIEGQYTIDYQQLLRDAEQGSVSLPLMTEEIDRRAARMNALRQQSRRINPNSLNSGSFEMHAQDIEGGNQIQMESMEPIVETIQEGDNQ